MHQLRRFSSYSDLIAAVNTRIGLKSARTNHSRCSNQQVITMRLPQATADTLCLVGLLLALCVGSLEAGRHRKWKSKRSSDVHIEIYHPKGLIVWYPQKPGVVKFGIEIFLNKQLMMAEEPVNCDICQNTTEVSYGKFIIENDDAIIRGGDHLMYNAIKQKANGSAYITRSNEFYVSESRIISRQKKECSLKGRSSLEKSKQSLLEEEIYVLQGVVHDIFLHCNNVTRSSKNLYLNFRPADTRLDSKGLYNYTLNVLKEMLPQVDWETVLIHTFYYDDGIAFEVKTLIDKLKVLQMSKNFNQFTVSDMDDLDGSSNPDNEIELYDA
ncbi:uncharacterized protein LOC131678241 [Topomyia yanbarensis]|uniref:uncharacterized protein LOC131678241 n=1 Tax=Topomyia yanbarensis TaxID=2498891 RepID=UPI00273BE9CE|nr:uncharacterized protein LOC131678241 [Topomyia yanbarensis]